MTQHILPPDDYSEVLTDDDYLRGNFFERELSPRYRPSEWGQMGNAYMRRSTHFRGYSECSEFVGDTRYL